MDLIGYCIKIQLHIVFLTIFNDTCKLRDFFQAFIIISMIGYQLNEETFIFQFNELFRCKDFSRMIKIETNRIITIEWQIFFFAKIWVHPLGDEMRLISTGTSFFKNHFKLEGVEQIEGKESFSKKRSTRSRITRKKGIDRAWVTVDVNKDFSP